MSDKILASNNIWKTLLIFPPLGINLENLVISTIGLIFEILQLKVESENNIFIT